MSEHVEVAVIGGGLTAALTTALLAKKGVRGLLLDAQERDRPLSPLLTRLHPRASSIQKVQARLGKAQTRSVPVHLSWAKERLDLFGAPEALIAHFGRVLKHRARGLRALLERIRALDEQAELYLEVAGELPAHGFLAKRNAAALKRKHAELFGSIQEDAAFQEAQEVLAPLLSSLPFLTNTRAPAAELEPLTIARALTTLFEGLRIEDPRDRLFESARERFELVRGFPEALKAKGGAVHFQLTDRTVVAEMVIEASCDHTALSAWPGGRFKKTPRPVDQLSTVEVEMDADALPDALLGPVIFHGVSPGSVMIARVPSEGARRRVWVSGEGLEPERAIEHLAQIAPFVHEAKPRAQPLNRPLLHSYWPQERPMRTGLKNVFVSTGGLPAWGAEAAYFNALQGVQLVDELRKKRR